MQEINVKDVMIVRKSQLKSYVKKKLVQRPELFGKCTHRMLLEAMIFIEGYASAIEKDIHLPIIKKDLQQLLLEQGLNYIISRIDQ